MASVLQPLLVAAAPEILHLDAKSICQRSTMSASTAASSRSTSPISFEDVADRLPRRYKTVGETNVVKLDAEYPFGLVARDSDDDAPLRKSKTSPAFDDNSLFNAYPTGLVVRNTFLEFIEEPVFLQMRRVKSAPSSPVAARGKVLTPSASTGVELANMSSTPQTLGVRGAPTIGSAKHHLGECKPCAFFWKPAGCTNDENCVYCHLCDATEKKRRQKEKKALLKAQNRS